MSRKPYIYNLNSTVSTLIQISTTVQNHTVASSMILDTRLVAQGKPCQIIQLVLIAVLIAVALTGNTLILVSVYKFAYLRTVSSYLVANLSIIDLALSLLILPTVAATIANQTWMQNTRLCVAAGFIDNLLTNAQVMALLSIGINRYVAMRHPQWYNSRMNKRLFAYSLLFGWVYALLWSIPPFIGWGCYSYTKGALFCGVCWKQTPYFAISHFAMSYVVPGFAGLYFYVGVLKAVSRYMQQIGVSAGTDRAFVVERIETTHFKHKFNVGEQERNPPTIFRKPVVTDSPMPMLKRQEEVIENNAQNNIALNAQSMHQNSNRLSQVTKAFLIIVITFLICWIPRGIANIWAVSKERSSVPLQLEVYSTLLIFSTSALNPIVYGFCRADFRRAFKQVVVFWKYSDGDL
eukprot:gene20575-22599_t